jgi:hypothetical protein
MSLRSVKPADVQVRLGGHQDQAENENYRSDDQDRAQQDRRPEAKDSIFVFGGLTMDISRCCHVKFPG